MMMMTFKSNVTDDASKYRCPGSSGHSRNFKNIKDILLGKSNSSY